MKSGFSLGIIVFILLGLVSSCEEEKAMEVSAEQLASDYLNEAEANKKYQGKKLLVTGKVLSKGTDLRNSPYLVFTPKDGQNEGLVQCFFADGGILKQIEINTTIKVLGSCQGKVLNVFMSDCIIQP